MTIDVGLPPDWCSVVLSRHPPYIYDLTCNRNFPRIRPFPHCCGTKVFDDSTRLVGEINEDRPVAADIIAQRVRPSVVKWGDGQRAEIFINHRSGRLKSSPIPIPDLRTTRDVAIQQ